MGHSPRAQRQDRATLETGGRAARAFASLQCARMHSSGRRDTYACPRHTRVPRPRRCCAHRHRQRLLPQRRRHSPPCPQVHRQRSPHGRKDLHRRNPSQPHIPHRSRLRPHRCRHLPTRWGQRLCSRTQRAQERARSAMDRVAPQTGGLGSAWQWTPGELPAAQAKDYLDHPEEGDRAQPNCAILALSAPQVGMDQATRVRQVGNAIPHAGTRAQR
jgi:hypothetical protein